MTQSQDRIHFTCKDSNANREITVSAAMKAFGLSRHDVEAAFDDYRRMVCRPSQFARFIVFRAEGIKKHISRHVGMTNGFTQFEAELVNPAHSEFLDVSQDFSKSFRYSKDT